MPYPEYPYPYTYHKPSKGENIALGVGALLSGLLNAAGGESTGDAIIRGIGGAAGGYSQGWNQYQNQMGDAFNRYMAGQEYNRRFGNDEFSNMMEASKYNQGIKEYEETQKPSSEAYRNYMNKLTNAPPTSESLPGEAKTWEYAENIQDPRKRSEFKARAMPMRKSDQTNINVSTGSGSKFIEELGKKSAEEFVKQKETAQDSLNTLNIISEAKNKIDSGIYTGAGANAKLFMDKWLQTAGINIGGETASNTEAFAGAVGSLVGKLIRQFGSGTGLSDADREYAQKIAGGEITMTDMSIRKLFDIAQRAQRFQVSSYNKMFEKIQSTHGKENMPYDMSIDLPKEMDFGVSNLESGNFGQETQMQKIGNYLYDPTTGKYYKQ